MGLNEYRRIRKRDVKVTAERFKFITLCCLIKAKFGLELAIPKTKLIYVAEGTNLIGLLYIAKTRLLV